MKYFLIMILMYGCLSCGDKGDLLSHNVQTARYVDIPVAGVLNEIEEDLGRRTESTVLVESDLKFKQKGVEKSAIALCYRRENLIKIDVEKIKRIGASVKLVLLHEIGHCTYGYRDYTPKKIEGCTENIMRWGADLVKCEKHYKTYVKQILEGVVPTEKERVIY